MIVIDGLASQSFHKLAVELWSLILPCWRLGPLSLHPSENETTFWCKFVMGRWGSARCLLDYVKTDRGIGESSRTKL